MKPTALACLITLASAAWLAPAPAQAVGRLLDVSIVDRDSGASLPTYRHNGQWWVAGHPGARYAIRVHNRGSGRLMGVMSVDGVNVITGDTAGWGQSGYVFAPHQSAHITGWRKSESEVAAFHFTSLPRSYAARTGRPENVGVIGVAVFRENAPVYSPPYPHYPPRPPYPPRPWDIHPYESRQGESSSAPADAGTNGARRESAPAAKSMPTPPRLGTGHGRRESSWAGNTHFERRSSQPDEVITIRYDSYDNLVAMGIIPHHHTPMAARPHPFPTSPDAHYVPDPPRWR